jgi:predicted sulfurtransferase
MNEIYINKLNLIRIDKKLTNTFLTFLIGWIEENKHLLEGKKVLMYCTAGVRCERASAFMRNKGVENVYQLDGGVHRYLDAFPKDGGYWVGKNYTFDKRFSHGAEESVCVSSCVFCKVRTIKYIYVYIYI